MYYYHEDSLLANLRQKPRLQIDVESPHFRRELKEGIQPPSVLTNCQVPRPMAIRHLILGQIAQRAVLPDAVDPNQIFS